MYFGLRRVVLMAVCYGAQAPVSFDLQAPAAAFSDDRIATIFFRTTACLRHDQSMCYPQGSPWYDISHAGLDVMMRRFHQ